MITSKDFKEFAEIHSERGSLHRYIYKRDLKKYGWEWMHERSTLGDEELSKAYLGQVMNEIDLMLLLKINGKYIWEKE